MTVDRRESSRLPSSGAPWQERFHQPGGRKRRRWHADGIGMTNSVIVRRSLRHGRLSAREVRREEHRDRTRRRGVRVVALVAQTKINPTDPQPTCEMCPGYYIPASELQAYTKKAIAEKLIDQQVRDVDIGKAHVGIGMVHRGKLDAPRPNSVAEHDQVSEVYHVIDGSGDAGPRSGHHQPAAATRHAADGPRVQRAGQQRLGHPQRRDLRPQARRRRGDPGGHRPLVHEDRRSHRLPDGPHRSGQGHAAQGRSRIEGVSVEAGEGGGQ